VTPTSFDVAPTDEEAESGSGTMVSVAAESDRAGSQPSTPSTDLDTPSRRTPISPLGLHASYWAERAVARASGTWP